MTPSQPREEGEETILPVPVAADPTSEECSHPRTEVVASGEAREATKPAGRSNTEVTDNSRGGQIHSGSAAPTGSSPSVSGERKWDAVYSAEDHTLISQFAQAVSRVSKPEVESRHVDRMTRLEREILRRLEMVDRLLNHCDKEDGECEECAHIACPFEDPLHFHHDGCPSCSEAIYRANQRAESAAPQGQPDTRVTPNEP